MTPEEFVNHYHNERASAILRTDNETIARNAMQAAVSGGFKIIEFTMSIPNTTGLIREFAADSNLTVGAGTVLTREQVDAVVEAGAQFVVSPVVDVNIIEYCQKLGVACMPGCSTPTEMLTAHRAGAPLQKLFPQTGTGPLYVKHCKGPLPFLRIVPTSGVTLDNVAAYFQAGAHAVGFVASLFDANDMTSGNFSGIEERAKKMLAAATAN